MYIVTCNNCPFFCNAVYVHGYIILYYSYSLLQFLSSTSSVYQCSFLILSQMLELTQELQTISSLLRPYLEQPTWPPIPSLHRSNPLLRKSPVMELVQRVRTFKQQTMIPTVCQLRHFLKVTLLTVIPEI